MVWAYLESSQHPASCSGWFLATRAAQQARAAYLSHGTGHRPLVVIVIADTEVEEHPREPCKAQFAQAIGKQAAPHNLMFQSILWSVLHQQWV